MFESLALCFAAYKPSFGWEITWFTRLRISLQRFAQFATGRIRRGGHDKQV
jgi:hypothetical protein